MKVNAVSDGEVVKESPSTGYLITLPSGKPDGFCTPNFVNGSGSSDVMVIRDGASTQGSEHDYSGEEIVISMPDTGRSLDMKGLTEKNPEITDSIVNGSRRSDIKVIRDRGFTQESEHDSSIGNGSKCSDVKTIRDGGFTQESEHDSSEEGRAVPMTGKGGRFGTDILKTLINNQTEPEISVEDDIELKSLLSRGEVEEITKTIYGLPGVGYYKSRKNRAVRISNFTIFSISKTNVINANEEQEIETTFQFGYTDENTDKRYELSIPLKETMNLQTHIEQGYPDCMVYMDLVGNAKGLFKQIVSTLYRRIAPIPASTVYSFSGWSPLIEGRRFYLHGGRPDCRTEIEIPPLDPAKDAMMIKEAMKIANVADKSVIRPLICYQIESFLSAPFEDAGFPNRHSLMMVGSTGSGKTSLARVIFAPFQPTGIHSFRDTTASFRHSVENARDNVFLLDDFLQEGKRSKVTENKEKLWKLVRAYSDSTFGAKYKNSKGNYETTVRGGCVFTAEEEPTSEMESASLRYIKVPFHEINWESLTEFQTNPEIFKVFYAEVIGFIERHYADIVDYIKQNFRNVRDEYSKRLRKNRMADTAADLCLSSHVLAQFLKDKNIWTEETAKVWESENKEIFAQLAEGNEKSSRNRNPITRFLRALLDMEARKKCRFACNIDEYVNHTEEYIGYYCQEVGTGKRLLMLQESEAYRCVTNELEKVDDYLNVSLTTVVSKLKRIGLSKCDAGSNLKRPPSKIPGRARMLCLKMDEVERYLQKEESISTSAT